MAKAAKLISDRVEVVASAEAASDYAYGQGWTDGLPIIPPTEKLVRRMVEYSGRSPDEVIALIPPALGEATIEKIAVNAVMAGCLPEYMSVIMASVQAVVEKEFNLPGIQATTHPVGPMLVINGPIRDKLNINSGANCMGQGWRSNATIGRALRLILLNIGGAIAGTVDKSTQGMPGKFSYCYGENEEDSPWEPLHVERGFQASDSVVTAIGAAAPLNIMCGSRGGRSMLILLANAMSVLGTNNMNHAGEPLIIMCPPNAQMMAEEGFSKEQARQFLFENSRVSIDSWPNDKRSHIMAGDGHMVDGFAYPAKRVEDVMIVVAGGPGGLHSSFVATFGETRAVSKRIESS
ncbi:MAG: hypothetical protein HYX92_08280 [Chloroflexi bacterium]|nr:hypothetical protein [Chloroflexota bacterium]